MKREKNESRKLEDNNSLFTRVNVHTHPNINSRIRQDITTESENVHGDKQE